MICVRVERNWGRYVRQEHSWVVELGTMKRFLFWRFYRWERFSTCDDGDTWQAWETDSVGSRASWLLHPQHHMAKIDVLLGALIPHLRAAGRGEKADEQRKRQETYWAKQDARRARLADGAERRHERIA